mmetsp:Transcript_43978/g.116296  ORF Transcript_43978/g.116296 Transcript_43978/m.116296 type:complete len:150 (-) Transcript_43978:47-496(-)
MGTYIGTSATGVCKASGRTAAEIAAHMRRARGEADASVLVESGVCPGLWNYAEALGGDPQNTNCTQLQTGCGTSACDGDVQPWCQISDTQWCYCETNGQVASSASRTAVAVGTAMFVAVQFVAALSDDQTASRRLDKARQSPVYVCFWK